MTMTRDEHLAWAKARALQYIEFGQLTNAVTSMIADLRKHEAFDNYTLLANIGLGEILSNDPERVRKWINDFN